VEPTSVPAELTALGHVGVETGRRRHRRGHSSRPGGRATGRWGCRPSGSGRDVLASHDQRRRPDRWRRPDRCGGEDHTLWGPIVAPWSSSTVLVAHHPIVEEVGLQHAAPVHAHAVTEAHEVGLGQPVALAPHSPADAGAEAAARRRAPATRRPHWRTTGRPPSRRTCRPPRCARRTSSTAGARPPVMRPTITHLARVVTEGGENPATASPRRTGRPPRAGPRPR
jgi:hypothetical protein